MIPVNGLVSKINNIIAQIDSYPNLPRPYADLSYLVKESLPFLSDTKDFSSFWRAGISGRLGDKYLITYQSYLIRDYISVTALEQSPLSRRYVVTTTIFKKPYSAIISLADNPDNPLYTTSF